MVDPEMDPSSLSEIEKKKLRLKKIAQEQMDNQLNSEPEEGIKEQSMTEIPGRAGAIAKLKEKMPLLGEAADIVVPADLEDLNPLVRGEKAIARLGKRLSQNEEKKLIQHALRSEGTEAVEKIVKSNPDEKAAKYAKKFTEPERAAEKFVADKELGLVKSNPKAGPEINYKEMNTITQKPEGSTIDYQALQKVKQAPEGPSYDYKAMKTPEPDMPLWRKKQLNNLRKKGFN